jgi:hypothetical protein
VDDVVLMDFLLLQELTLTDLFHLPYGGIIFDNLQLGGFDKRHNLKR